MVLDMKTSSPIDDSDDWVLIPSVAELTGNGGQNILDESRRLAAQQVDQEDRCIRELEAAHAVVQDREKEYCEKIRALTQTREDKQEGRESVSDAIRAYKRVSGAEKRQLASKRDQVDAVIQELNHLRGQVLETVSGTSPPKWTTPLATDAMEKACRCKDKILELLRQATERHTRVEKDLLPSLDSGDTAFLSALTKEKAQCSTAIHQMAQFDCEISELNAHIVCLRAQLPSRRESPPAKHTPAISTASLASGDGGNPSTVPCRMRRKKQGFVFTTDL